LSPQCSFARLQKANGPRIVGEGRKSARNAVIQDLGVSADAPENTDCRRIGDRSAARDRKGIEHGFQRKMYDTSA
jgi:hypothetical protein